MKDILDWLKKHLTIVSFVLLAIIFYMIAVRDNITVFQIDSYYYWIMGDGIYYNPGDRFDFRGFPETFRGYLYPFLLSTLKFISFQLKISEIVTYRIVVSICMSCFIVIVLPYLMGIQKKGIRYFLGNIFMCFTLCMYWKDYWEYPFSDLPAMILFLSFAAVGKYVRSCWNTLKMKKMILVGLGGGILCYAAYNTRIIYMYGLMFLILLFLFDIVKNIFKHPEIRIKEVGKAMCLATAFIAGMGITAYPQILINQHYTGQWTPRVLSEQLMGYETELTNWQLFTGITNQRYEGALTTAEEGVITGVTGVTFKDPAGVAILEQEGILLDSYSEYTMQKLFKLYFKYPLDFIGIYMRHFMSHLTMLYSGLFIFDIGDINLFILVSNILIWITGGVMLFANGIKNNRLYLLALLIPCILIIPGAPEVRFFVCAYFLLYGYLAYTGNWGKTLVYIKNNIYRVITMILIITAFWLMFISDLLTRTGAAVYLIS